MGFLGTMADTQFYLFCSGLEQYALHHQEGLNKLHRFFSRSDKSPLSENKAVRDRIAELLAFSLSESVDLPVAAIQASLISETIDKKTLWFGRLDPVVVIPNRDHLLLLGNTTFELSEEEARQIISGLNEFLADEGIQIHALTPKQWIVSSEKNFTLLTTAPEQAFGQDVKRVMPIGGDASYWQKITNEIQMWLHTCEVNQHHMALGRQTVNSVWLWGTGNGVDMESALDATCFIDENNSYLHGLANTYGQTFIDVDQQGEQLEQCFEQVRDKYIGVLNIDSLHRMDQLNSMIGLAMDKLASGKLDRISITTESHEFVLTRWCMKRFWRTTKDFGLYFR